MRTNMRAITPLALILLLAGCAADPFDRPYTWSPMNSNDSNLRVMLVHPSDLAQGVDAPGSLSAEASPPVKRLLSGQRTKLPTADASTIGNESAQSGSAPPAPAAPY
jgi:hypothetical protein